MLKAIHASEDIAAAREKAVRVIEKLRGLRLTRAAEAAMRDLKVSKKSLDFGWIEAID